MATPETGEWRDLFDVALFEPNRGKLRLRIESARQAIKHRLDVLVADHADSAKTISEHIALRDALATLAELQKIVYARRPSTRSSSEGGRVAS